MKRIFLICIASLALSSCAALPTTLPESPAPLAATTIDDTALSVAWKAFDAVLDGVDLWAKLRPEVKGTAKAQHIATAIDKTTKFLTAAESAAAAGSTTDYKLALINAKAALTELRSALQE